MTTNNNVENKIIAEPTVHMKGIALPTSDLISQIPEDERAIEQLDTSVIEVMKPVLSAAVIPEEEQAVEDGENNALSVAKEQDLFSDHFRMSHIKGVLNDRLYAAIRIDENGKYYYDICERYNDGTFSPKMTIGQADLFMLQMCKKGGQSSVTAKMKNRADKLMMKLMEEYLMKYRGTDSPLDLGTTVETLIAIRASLHVQDNVPKVLPAEDFYNQVVSNIKQIQWECPHKAYYAFDNDCIEYLAELMEMKKVDFLKKLKEYGFLYLTNSSRGYQTNVRFKITPENRAVVEEINPSCIGKDYYTEWSYCIYKMDFIGNAMKQNKK